MLYMPGASILIFVTVPKTFGGHMILWSRMISFSKTVPKMSPPLMGSPTLKFNGLYWYLHLEEGGKEETYP